MRKRTWAMLAALLIVFAGLGTRIGFLSNGVLQEASTAQSTQKQTVAVARGTIYDRYLQPLVNADRKVVALLAPTQACMDVVKQNLEQSEAEQVTECFAAGTCAVATLPSWIAPTDGVTQFFTPIRYGDNALARHVIGYVSGDGRGVTGVEKGYDERLSSFDGRATVSYAVDALGRVQEGKEVEAENTLSQALGGIALTLDAQIQDIVQRKAAAYLERGAVLVSAVNSGDVLASVSLPLYDQNHVEEALDDAASPLLDRTTVNYNCGSVFKIVTAAAALENGVPPEKTYLCTGACEVGGMTVRCHNPLGDGVVTMAQAMALSCNCYFIQLALDVGADAIYELAEKAGWSQAMYIADGCTTARGLLPSREDLSAEAALANFCIGQGDLMATPYHVHALMQAVAGDGLQRAPRLYLGAVNEKGVLATEEPEKNAVPLMSYETAKTLRTMLCGVVKEGTGTSAAPAIGTAAGKTGTAETGWEIDSEEVVQSWFTGCYPAEQPQYVITILSENGGVNGRTAAPLFADICNGLLQAGLVENAQDLY